MKRILIGTLLVLGVALAVSASASGDVSVTGTLLTRNADSIIVRTVDGERTFAINDTTAMSGDLAIDSQVTVTYRESGGTAMASQVLPAIAPAPAASEPSPPSPEPAASVAPVEPAPYSAAPAAETLPATASQLPLLALIGAVLLTAGVALRWAR